MQLLASIVGRPASTNAAARCRSSGSTVLAQQQREDPSSNPNYRRGSQNDYWRKRTNDRKSSSGKSVSSDNAKRRRGRSAHLRSPDDTPLRDGNRDRLMGLLTERAAHTLEASLAGGEAAEGNPTLQRWLRLYRDENAIPRDGNWSDVSGESFLRTLLNSPAEEIAGSFSEEEGGDFLSASPVGGDPRGIAQQIMDLRHTIAKEWMEELELVKQENKLLMNEALMKSMQSEGISSSNGGSGSSGNGSGDGNGVPPAVEQEQSAAQQRKDEERRRVDIEALDDSAGGIDD